MVNKPKLTSEERQAILSMGAIRCVPISPTEKFYVFHYPGTKLSWAQNLGEKCDGWDVQKWGADFCMSKQHRRNACYIFRPDANIHKDRLIYRESNNARIPKEKLIKAGLGRAIKILIEGKQIKDISTTEVEVLVNRNEFNFSLLPNDQNYKFTVIFEQADRGIVDDYLRKYWKKICDAHEFTLDNSFKVQMTTQNLSDHKGHPIIVKEVDYFEARPEVSLSSFPGWKPVKKLLKSFDLFKDKYKAGEKVSDSTIKERNEFIIQKAKELTHRFRTAKRLCVAIEDYLKAEAAKRFTDKETNREQMTKFRIFTCRDSTIGNVIRPIAKGLIAKSSQDVAGWKKHQSGI